MIMVQDHRPKACDSAGASHLSVSGQTKRKLSIAHEGEIPNIVIGTGQNFSQLDVKKVKTSSDDPSCIKADHSRVFFTAATEPVWRRIFAYLPPASLGCLLRVSVFFKGMLESPASRTNYLFELGGSLSEPHAAEMTWSRCRRHFAPGLPQPLVRQSEIAMWRLIKGSRCHECGIRKPLRTLSNALTEWASGPEREQLRIIWAFRVRICGSCLCRLSTTEKDLVLDTSFPSFLIDGLPFVLLLNSENVVSESTFRRCAVPFGTTTSKIFFKPQVDFLKGRFLKLREEDASGLQSWLSTLQSEREKMEDDASRWEAWEIKGALAKINWKGLASTNRQSSIDNTPLNKQELSARLKSPHSQGRNCETSSYNHTILSGSVKTSHVRVADVLTDTASQNANSLASHPKALTVQSTRRDQIIRRCLALSSPIETQELERLPSFKAALTIAKEMDDQQWAILKPHLEAEAASSRIHHDRTSHEISGLRSTNVHNHKGPNVRFDRSTALGDLHHTLQENQTDVCVTIQGISVPVPNLRTTLASIAKNIKRERWDNGNLLSKDSCFQFAVDTLLLTHDAYRNSNVLRADDSILSPAHFSLEDMKWLFDTEVKPLTEKYQREVFFCHICGNVSKSYGFEAVLQHFAAKHTRHFSMDAAVVNWKANWPEYPPFHPNPMLLKPFSRATLMPESHSGFDESQHGKSYLERSYLSAESPAEFRDPIRKLRDNALLPKPNEHLDSEFASSAGSQNPYLIKIPTLRNEGYVQSSPSLSNLTYATVQGDHHTMYPREHPDLCPQPPEAVSTNLTGPTTDTFRFHQAEMAKLAREYWFATAGVKGFAGATRVQVIIYHASERFVARFQLEPGVNMFLFGLNHEAAMRPLRSLNGFSCQACSLEQPGALHPSLRKSSATLPHLLNHFMTAHAEYFGLDWRKDMIQLPSKAAIADLAHAPGMDETKFSLLASCFPGIFPTSSSYPPLHQTQTASPSTSIANYSQSLNNYNGLALLSDNGSEKASGYSGIIFPNSTHLTLCNGERNDEYDPRRPSYVGKIVDAQNFDKRGAWCEDTGVSNSWSRTSSPLKTSDQSQVEVSDRFLELIPSQNFSQDPKYHTSNYPISRDGGREDNLILQHTNPTLNDGYHNSKGKHRPTGSKYEPSRAGKNTNHALQEDYTRCTSYHQLPRRFERGDGHGEGLLTRKEHGQTLYNFTSGMRRDGAAQFPEQPSQNFTGFTVAATDPSHLPAMQKGGHSLSKF